MKVLAPLLAIVLCLLAFSGCGHAAQPLHMTPLPREEIPLAAAPEVTPTVAATAPAATVPTAVPAGITAEEAKTIALTHAGVSPEQVRFLRVGFDRDDRIPQYEVEFVIDGWEYEYDIHAETGEILSFDKDR